MLYFTGEWYADNVIMTSMLDEVDFYSGTERKQMLKVPFKEGGSMLYGTTWRGYLSPTKTRTKDPETGLYRTKVYDLHPELKDVFKEFADLYFPDFEYTQVQMNKNFPCPPHKDKKNIGKSVLCCFGNYTGGDTCLYIDDKIVKINSQDKPQRFNGSKVLHWVEQYKGTRYSLVFFINRKK
tara:strand:- start:542 stop:1084 length:543 start_codon:yes stop_codon:yes gene_type:complete